MITSTYQFLKNKGTTTYTFPSGSEDEAILRANPDFGMAFSHIVLLKIPRQENNKVNPDTAFTQSTASTQPSKFSEQIIESLRNYVANHDTVIRSSKTNNNQYYYNVNEISTPTEKIFWKWLKKLNVLSLEPAQDDEYYRNISEFDSNGPIGSTDFLRKYLWKERKVEDLSIININSITLSPVVQYSKKMVFNKTTNYRIGDKLFIKNITGLTYITVLNVATTTLLNDSIIFAQNGTFTVNINSTAKLDYERVVKGIAEVTADSSEIRPDGSFQRLYSLIPYEFGETPYVLFSTESDLNYKPNSVFPIKSSEQKPEINGAERSDSVFFTNPLSYPGDHYAQYDTAYTYTTSIGDSLKRKGDYYGISLDTNNLIFPNLDGTNIDGINIDFNIKHYKYAQDNIPICNNFTEFSSAIYGGEASKDFDFNAVLWYYDVIDETSGVTLKKKNLYAIQFLENPDNDLNVLKNYIPSYTKLVHDGYKDGTSYNLSLITETVSNSSEFISKFDPTRGHDSLNYDLYSQAIKKLANLNSIYLNMYNNMNFLQSEINTVKNLLGTMPSYTQLYDKMDNMENLLNSYKTLNITSSDTIESNIDMSLSPPMVKLNSIDKTYGIIETLQTKNLYTLSGNNAPFNVVSIPYTINVVNKKDILVLLDNNDEYNTININNLNIPKLQLNIQKDLDYKQKIDFIISVDNLAAYNKGLNININFSDGTTTSNIPLLTDLLLPTNQINSTELDYANDTINDTGIIPLNFYYKKNSNNRYIGFDTTLDCRYLKQNSCLYFKDLKLKINSNIYNLSNIYQLDSIQINKGKIKNIKVIQNGTSTANSTRNIWLSHTNIADDKSVKIVLKYNNSSNLYYSNIDYNVGTNFLPFNENNNFYYSYDGVTFTQISTSNILSTLSDNVLEIPSLSGGTSTKIRILFENTYNLEFKINDNRTNILDTFSSTYIDDDKYYLNAYNNSNNDNKIKLIGNVIISPFKGYKITLIRNTTNDNILASEWYKRYKIIKEIL